MNSFDCIKNWYLGLLPEHQLMVNILVILLVVMIARRYHGLTGPTESKKGG